MAVDQTLFDATCQHARQAMLLHSAADTLEWDERTGMPIAAGDYRAEQVSILRAQTHKLRTEAKFGEHLAQLSEQIGDEDPSEDVASTVRELRRDFERNSKLPTELVERISKATVVGQQTWDAARQADDFSQFRDCLAQIIELKREEGERLAEGTELSTYDALLDEYEPGARADELQVVFDDLRKPLVDLINRIAESPVEIDTSLLTKVFGIDEQRDFSHQVADAIGFDFERGRLDETSHPFCTTLGPDDCRILTRFDPHWLPAGLFGTMHEAGHGMYEQGLRREWFGLPPGSFASLGVHESQSRLWENQVGRSKPFWDWLFLDAQHQFAPQLQGVTPETFYAAVNSVTPSLIRVEADEATYNLHIIIRFDLEQQLISGSLGVDELPDAWHARYESDLGVRAPSDADGVLQDVHWSAGLFGYFPTYTLGNLIGAQLFDAASERIGDLETLIGQGEFRPLLDWLRTHVHYYGQNLGTKGLVEHATGKPLSADHLINYLKAKLEPLYKL